MIQSWALLHQAGFVTYPHYDAEGTLTFIKMEVGVKYWVLFKLKEENPSRSHLIDALLRLGNFAENEDDVRERWDAEVVTLLPGEML